MDEVLVELVFEMRLWTISASFRMIPASSFKMRPVMDNEKLETTNFTRTNMLPVTFQILSLKEVSFF